MTGEQLAERALEAFEALVMVLSDEAWAVWA